MDFLARSPFISRETFLSRKIFQINTDMSRQSIVLYSKMATESAERVGGPNLGDTVDLLYDYAPNPIYCSKPVRVDQWFNSPSHQLTISIVASNFIGVLILEASIKANPGPYDWFPILLDGTNPSLTYPDYFLGAFAGTIRGETSNRAYNFAGRYTWLRIKIDTTNTDGIPYGFIDRILVNL